MKKQLIVGVAVLLICIALSGCNEQTALDKEDDTNNTILQTHFTISGTITNNYGEDVDVDYSVVENRDEWSYWAPTIHVLSYEVKDFSCGVKLDYDLYLLIAQWFYPNTDTEGCLMVTENIEEPTGEDLVYYIEVKSNGEIVISETEPELTTNEGPTASIDASVTTGYVPLTVDFTAIGEDIDGYITEYNWDFSDGAYSNEQNPSHTFGEYKTYYVKLTVTDDKGAIGSDTITIITQFPSPEIIDTAIGSNVYGDKNVHGLIKNNGELTITNVKLSITVYDASNNIITETEMTIDELIPAKEIMVFLWGFGSSYYDHYDIQISDYDVTSEEIYDDFTIDDEGIKFETSLSGEYIFSVYVRGTIKNIGSKIAESVMVYCIFYNSYGEYIHYGSGWGGDILYSGQESNFVCSVDSYESDRLSEISSYEFITSCEI